MPEPEPGTISVATTTAAATTGTVILVATFFRKGGDIAALMMGTSTTDQDTDGKKPWPDTAMREGRAQAALSCCVHIKDVDKYSRLRPKVPRGLGKNDIGRLRCWAQIGMRRRAQAELVPDWHLKQASS